MQVRIQKVFSKYGIASRRQTEKLILAGDIKVNGKLAELGTTIDPDQDKVLLKNKPVNFVASDLVYYVLNKPKEYVSTTREFSQEKKVTDLVPKEPKVWPVGRLDKYTHGLIILTNDGDFTQQMTHPKFEHKKEYLVRVNKDLNASFVKGMLKGVSLEEGFAQADKIIRLNEREFRISIHQGLNRQIRRMCAHFDYRVVDLERTALGRLRLADLDIKEGEYVKVSRKDVIKS